METLDTQEGDQGSGNSWKKSREKSGVIRQGKQNETRETKTIKIRQETHQGQKPRL